MIATISSRKIAQIIVMSRDMTRSEEELRAFIEAMNTEEKAAAVAVMWIGRGSFDPEDLQEAYETALDEASTPTEDYLMGTPHLPENLEAGLEALGISASDAEEDVM